MATSKDIAASLGISRGTVSRALNNKGRVSEETRKRILDAAHNLEYVPNRAARALVRGKPAKAVISLFSQPEDFWRPVKEGIHLAYSDMKHLGMELEILESGLNDPEKQASQLISLINSDIKAVAVAPNDPAYLTPTVEKLHKAGIPVFTFNVDIPSSHRICYLGCDYQKAGRLAGDILGKLLQGRGLVASFCFSPPVTSIYQRVLGFHEVLRQYPDIDVISVNRLPRSGEGAYEFTRSFLDQYPELSGLFVSFGILDEVARAVHDSGRGRSIKLVGYDLSDQTEAFIREGTICCTICHEPLLQGFLVTRLLYNYVMEGQLPSAETIHTKLELVMEENLESAANELNRMAMFQLMPSFGRYPKRKAITT